MRLSAVCVVSVVLLALPLAPMTAAPPTVTYPFTALDLHPKGLATFIPTGINDVGQMVGIAAAFRFFGAFGAFFYDNGVLTDINDSIYPNCPTSFGGSGTCVVPTDINNRGQIVGYIALGHEDNIGRFICENQAFIFQGTTTFINPPFPGASCFTAQGVNDGGRVVGTYLDSGGSTHSFLFDRGVFTSVDVPGAHDTRASDINNPRQIVGISSGGPFVLEHGVFRVFSGASAGGFFQLGINDRGDIVGLLLGQTTFVLEGDTMIPLEQFSGFFAEPSKINNRGVVVGFQIDRGDHPIGGVWIRTH